MSKNPRNYIFHLIAIFILCMFTCPLHWNVMGVDAASAGIWSMYCLAFFVGIDIVASICGAAIGAIHPVPFLIMPISQFFSLFGIFLRFLVVAIIVLITAKYIGIPFFNVNIPAMHF